MTPRVPALSRPALARPTPPVAAVHLGLGAFFRAHQAVYTQLAADGEEWGYVAFTGRSAALAEQLDAQDGLYTLLVQGPDGASASIVDRLAETRPGTDIEGWLGAFARPSIRLLTLTVTEAAYRRDVTGGPDLVADDVAADLAGLRAGDLADCRTVPGRLVAGLEARRRADAGPLTVVPCDNLLHNGAAVHRVVAGLAAAVDQALVDWIQESVTFVDTEVDRITPRTTDADRAAAQRLTGWYDASPVVTEPFSEWVLAGAFRGGRPRWESAGAQFVDDVRPFEERKLWLLNGAHSLLAYAGSIRGHRTVAGAMGDPACGGWVEAWWDEACRHLSLPADALAAYRAALVARFENPGIEHLLAQIAADGSQKLPVRVLPVLAAERSAGREAAAATRTLGAWVAHLRGHGAPVTDPRSNELTRLATGPLRGAVPRLLAVLDSRLPDDPAVVAAVIAHTEEFEREDQ